MNYILFDEGLTRNQLLPFTFTRPIADIRIGITTIREKWEQALSCSISSLTEDYLSEKYPLVQKKQNVLINAAFLPDPELISAIKKLKSNQALSSEDSIIAFRLGGDELDKFAEESPENMEEIEYKSPVDKIENICDLYLMNERILNSDFAQITQDRKSVKISKTNQVIGAENIFIEEGAVVEYATLNASKGPIYIGKNAEIMEGACLRGGVAVCEGAVVKMGAKIYGATTIGPYSKVGGELSNVVIFGYSNKAHDGFLGNAVLGEWCNLGADTNNSNLKNDYSEVKIWSYAAESFVPTGQTFCGLFMGDHSKTAINTMLNTGTVVGVGANIFGAGFPRQFVPSFTWGGKNYQIDKAVDTAVRVYARRQKEFTEMDENILRNVYANTHENREKGKF